MELSDLLADLSFIHWVRHRALESNPKAKREPGGDGALEAAGAR